MYKREDYDMITFLGDMGGLVKFLSTFGAVLSSPFILRLFYSSLVSHVYRIQAYFKDMSPYYQSSFKDGKLTAESNSDNGDEDGSPGLQGSLPDSFGSTPSP